MKARSAVECLLLALALSLPAAGSARAAQEATPVTGMPPRLRFRHLTMAEGLPSSWVHSIVKDRQGFVWFGTHQGLARFDGTRLADYRHDPDDPLSLPADMVTVLYEDREGRLWAGFGWSRQGLALYDRECDSFRRFVAGSGHDIRAIFEDHRGRLWIGTENGITEVNASDGSSLAYPLAVGAEDTRNAVVNAITEDKAGRLWVGTDEGLFAFEAESGRYERWPGAPGEAMSLSHAAVWDLLEDPDGTLWAATMGAGLLRIDPKDRRVVRQFLPDPADVRSLSQVRVRRLALGPEGQLFVGTENGGLDVLDTRSGEITRSRPQLEDESSLHSLSVWALLFDEQGVLWIGTHNGGVDWTTPAMERFGLFEARRGGLSDPYVSAVIEDHSGHLWVGTDGGGLNDVDRVRGTVSYYHHRSDDPGTLGGDAVQAILEDSHGNLWAGGWNGGLNLIDRASGRVRRFRHDTTDPHGLVSNDVWCLRQLPSGEIVLGTQAGAQVFDPDHRRFRDLGTGGPIGTVHTAVVQNGGVWLCGYNFPGDANVGYVSSSTGRTQYFRAGADGNHLAPWCLSALLDRAGDLWIGTQRGVQVRRKGQTDFQAFLAPGLPTDEVSNILEDAAGDLWMTAGQALARLRGRFSNSERLRVDTFDRSDGIFGPVPQGASLRGSQGELYFGGVRGLMSFLPDRIRINTVPPVVTMTDVKVLNRSLRPCVPGSRLRRNITLADAITLDYHDAIITFEFAALGLWLPERNRYEYKLEGFDADWSAPRAAHEVTYTNLSPGRYTFRVRGSNNDGVWSEKDATLRINITPPFWATWWFRLAVGVAVVGAVAREYRLRFATLAAKMEERTRLARELHDTLEQALAAVRMQLSAVGLSLRSAPDDAERNLDLARRMIGECLEEARRAVMELRAPSLDETDLEAAIAEQGHRLTAGTPISFNMSVSGRKRRQSDMVEHHLLRIGQEAMTNATKHSGGTRIDVELSYDPEFTTLVVRDNGHGLPEQPDSAHRHFGLRGMRERAQRIGAALVVDDTAEGVRVSVRVPRADGGA